MATIDPVRLGLDFDNTIVSYDSLFHRLAGEKSLIPPDLAVNKTAVRNHLRATGREEQWTLMQGVAYGTRMEEAAAFPGVLDFLEKCYRKNTPVFIISHRTLHPITGATCNLHAAALDWLRKNGVFDFVPQDRIFFELTRREKVERVRKTAPTHFIDDLPEFLTEPDFPENIQRILFNPQPTGPSHNGLLSVSSWLEISRLFHP